MTETTAPARWEVGAPDEDGPNPWAGAAPGVCDEEGCSAPTRRLLRYRGGVYLSQFCWEHGDTCSVCHGAIDDGEELCEFHAEALGVRYEGDLPDDVRRQLRANTHPLQRPPRTTQAVGG